MSYLALATIADHVPSMYVLIPFSQVTPQITEILRVATELGETVEKGTVIYKPLVITDIDAFHDWRYLKRQPTEKEISIIMQIDLLAAGRNEENNWLQYPIKNDIVSILSNDDRIIRFVILTEK